MTDSVYINGNWVSAADANVSVFDRGFLFADAVYEVVAVMGGRLVDFDAHIRRLERSLAALRLPLSMSRDTWLAMLRELAARNAIDEGIAYLQVSRGAAPRDFAYPANPKPTVVAFSQAKQIVDAHQAAHGLTVITQADIRWHRCDIKTVGLLGASMTKQAAIDNGADDAWFVDTHGVTEGTSSNAYIVTEANTLVTRQLGNEILAGITREVVLDVAREHALRIEERAFSVDEAIHAREAFITSATSFVMPVVRIDNRKIGTGVPGTVSRALRERYIARAMATAL